MEEQVIWGMTKPELLRHSEVWAIALSIILYGYFVIRPWVTSKKYLRALTSRRRFVDWFLRFSVLGILFYTQYYLLKNSILTDSDPFPRGGPIGAFGLSQSDLHKFFSLVSLAVSALSVIMFIVRPLIRNLAALVPIPPTKIKPPPTRPVSSMVFATILFVCAPLVAICLFLILGYPVTDSITNANGDLIPTYNNAGVENAPALWGLPKTHLFRLAQKMVVLITGILIAVFVVKPFLIKGFAEYDRIFSLKKSRYAACALILAFLATAFMMDFEYWSSFIEHLVAS